MKQRLESLMTEILKLLGLAVLEENRNALELRRKLRRARIELFKLVPCDGESLHECMW